MKKEREMKNTLDKAIDRLTSMSDHYDKKDAWAEQCEKEPDFVGFMTGLDRPYERKKDGERENLFKISNCFFPMYEKIIREILEQQPHTDSLEKDDLAAGEMMNVGTVRSISYGRI